jgi:hypothetical protein
MGMAGKQHDHQYKEKKTGGSFYSCVNHVKANKGSKKRKFGTKSNIKPPE